MEYTFLDGTSTSLDALEHQDLQWLLQLMQYAAHKEVPFMKLRSILAGPYAYALKGSQRVTKEIHDSLLYRIAEDIVDRAGIEQGYLAPNSEDNVEG